MLFVVDFEIYLSQPCQIFADDIKLYIHTLANCDGMEVCVLESVRDNGHAERIELAVAYGKAHTVDRDRAFLDRHISFCGKLGANIVLKRKVTAAISFLYICADGGGVDMALYDVPVKASVHQHRALKVYFVSGLEISEIRAFEGLAYRSDSVSIVSAKSDHSEAYAIVSHRLVDVELVGETATKSKIDICFVMIHSDNGCRVFYYSGKHAL